MRHTRALCLFAAMLAMSTCMAPLGEAGADHGFQFADQQFHAVGNRDHRQRVEQQRRRRHSIAHCPQFRRLSHVGHGCCRHGHDRLYRQHRRRPRHDRQYDGQRHDQRELYRHVHGHSRYRRGHLQRRHRHRHQWRADRQQRQRRQQQFRLGLDHQRSGLAQWGLESGVGNGDRRFGVETIVWQRCHAISGAGNITLGPFSGTQSFQLTFTWTMSASSTGGPLSGGPEEAVRLGAAGQLGFATADDYPGVGSRTQANDGQIVNFSAFVLSVPEPSGMVLAALGAIGFVLAATGRCRRS